MIVQAGERGGSAATARSAVSHDKKLLLLPSVAENTSWGRNYVSEGKAAIARNVSEIISALEAPKSRDRLVVQDYKAYNAIALNGAVFMTAIQGDPVLR